MEPIQGAPVNFFMGGGKYISDKFNMQIIDTSNPNAFDNLNLVSVKPDMMSEYIDSEKLPEKEVSDSGGKGFFASIVEFFAPQKVPETE